MSSVPALFLEFGERLAGVGGYAGACLDSLTDRILDFDPSPTGSVVHWTRRDVAAERLSAARWNWELFRIGDRASGEEGYIEAFDRALTSAGFDVVVD